MAESSDVLIIGAGPGRADGGNLRLPGRVDGHDLGQGFLRRTGGDYP